MDFVRKSRSELEAENTELRHQIKFLQELGTLTADVGLDAVRENKRLRSLIKLHTIPHNN